MLHMINNKCKKVALCRTRSVTKSHNIQDPTIVSKNLKSVYTYPKFKVLWINATFCADMNCRCLVVGQVCGVVGAGVGRLVVEVGYGVAGALAAHLAVGGEHRGRVHLHPTVRARS